MYRKNHRNNLNKPSPNTTPIPTSTLNIPANYNSVDVNPMSRVNRSLHERREVRRDDEDISIKKIKKSIREIERISSKQKSKYFSLHKDEEKVCDRGWKEFSSRLSKNSKERMTTYTKNISYLSNDQSLWVPSKYEMKCSKSYVFPFAQEKIEDLWGFVYGKQVGDVYSGKVRIEHLSKDVKKSLVLSNAYMRCLTAKNYLETGEGEFKEQRFKSYVYLKQNKEKLSKKRSDAIMRCNNFIQ